MAILTLLFCVSVLAAAVVVGLPWLIAQVWLLVRQVAAVPDRSGEIAEVEAEVRAERARKEKAGEEWEARYMEERAVADREAIAALLAESRISPEDRVVAPSPIRLHYRGAAAPVATRVKKRPLPPRNYNPDAINGDGAWVGASGVLHYPPQADLPRLRKEYWQARADRELRQLQRKAEQLQRIKATGRPCG